MLGGQDVGVNLFHNTGVAGESWQGDRIGGHEPWERNVIAGNASAEVRLHFAGNHAVIGNFIGTDVDGNALGSAFRAVDIAGSSDNLITDNVGSAITPDRSSTWEPAVITLFEMVRGDERGAHRSGSDGQWHRYQ